MSNFSLVSEGGDLAEQNYHRSRQRRKQKESPSILASESEFVPQQWSALLSSFPFKKILTVQTFLWVCDLV